MSGELVVKALLENSAGVGALVAGRLYFATDGKIHKQGRLPDAPGECGSRSRMSRVRRSTARRVLSRASGACRSTVSAVARPRSSS